MEVTRMDKNNISRDHLKNNQVPFFNGYKPNFYFKPKGETNDNKLRNIASLDEKPRR